MDDKKWKEFIQREMDKEMDEIEGVLEKINNDPVMREWKAPEGLRDGLFEQIHAKEAEKSRLSDDEKELIRLGMVYKKRRKWNKLLVLAAAVVCALAVGVTSIGGPKRVFEKFGWNIGDREQTNIDTDDDRIKEPDVVSDRRSGEAVSGDSVDQQPGDHRLGEHEDGYDHHARAGGGAGGCAGAADQAHQDRHGDARRFQGF